MPSGLPSAVVAARKLPENIDVRTVEGVSTAIWCSGQLFSQLEKSRQTPKNSGTEENQQPGRMLLVHGFRGEHHGLLPLAAGLLHRNPSLSLAIPDLPGYGRSGLLPQHRAQDYVPWLLALCQQLNIRHIVGHSFGSIIVARALAAGLRAEQTTLINPIATPALEAPGILESTSLKVVSRCYRWAQSLSRRGHERGGRLLISWSPVVRVFSQFMVSCPPGPLRGWIHDQHHRYFSDFKTVSNISESYFSSIADSVREQAPALQTPVQLITGEQDRIAPLSGQKKLLNLLPGGSQLEVIKDRGHLLHYEATAELTRLVYRWHFQEHPHQQMISREKRRSAGVD